MNAGEEKIFTKDFILILFSNFFIFLGFQMTLPTIPLFVHELGGTDQYIGIIVGVFTFSALLFRPYAGHALESKGRGVILLIGLAIFVLSVGSFGFLTTMLMLIIMRMVQGVGWGFSTTAVSTVATDIIPPKRRGEGLGYFGLSGNLALAFGPALGLTLADLVSFKTLFLICAVLGLLSLLAASQVKYQKAEKSRHVSKPARFDVLEKSAVNPSVLLFFVTLTFGGITSYLPLYAAEKDIAGIELYFITYAVFLMISRLFAGKIYDRKGDLFVIPPGILLIFIAMLLLAWLPNLPTLMFAGALYGLGFGAVQPSLQAWAVEKAQKNRKGMANATFFSFFDLGVGVGALLFGQLAFMFNYGLIYIVAACSVMLAFIYYVFLVATGKRKIKQINEM